MASRSESNVFNLWAVSRNAVSWMFQISLAILFIYVGVLKLFGEPQMVLLFQRVGVGQWLRLFTGFIEIVGALLLLGRSTAAYGGVLLMFTMLGAIATHVFDIGGSPILPVLFLLAAAVVVFARWRETAWVTKIENGGV